MQHKKLQEHNHDSTKQIVHSHMPLGFFSVDVFMYKIRSKIIGREHLKETERKHGRIKILRYLIMSINNWFMLKYIWQHFSYSYIERRLAYQRRDVKIFYQPFQKRVATFLQWIFTLTTRPLYSLKKCLARLRSFLFTRKNHNEL